MDRIFDLLYRIGQFIIFAFINVFYNFIILAGFFLINPLLKENIPSYILVFVLLAGFIGLAFERQAISVNQAFLKDQSYLRPYFNKLKDKLLNKYLVYSFEISVFYYLVKILSAFSSISIFFKILEIVFIFLYGNIVFYSILQFSLREYMGFILTIKNSIVLTYKYLIVSIANTVVFYIFSGYILSNIIFFLTYIIIVGIFINYCHFLMVNE